MKVKIYLKIAKTNGRNRCKVEARLSEDFEPLKSSSVYNGGKYTYSYLSTIFFAVDVNIPDEMFNQRTIGEFNLSEQNSEIAGKILKPIIKDLKIGKDNPLYKLIK